ncbi:MAG: CPBP family intramembrane glutamic endopeptidase [Bacteroidota bacterium]
MNNLNFSDNDLTVCLTLGISLLGFVVFWFVSQSKKLEGEYYSRYPAEKASEKFILFTKYWGFTWMGLIPALVCLLLLPQYTLGDYGLAWKSETAFYTLAWTAGLSLLVTVINFFNARKPKSQRMYPQIRAKEWNRKLLVRYFAGWFFYLLGYEFMFRGILLFPMADVLGLWPAIAINTAMYSATHIPKGLDETIGAALLGVVLCLLTIDTGTIWIAFLVHVALAWTNSWFALYHNKEVSWKK